MTFLLWTLACATEGSSTAPSIAEDGALSRIHEYNRKWYRDADGDQHGDPDVWIRGQTRPEGYRANATDCDDANADIHPGAQETSSDLDDDCDGFADDFPVEDASFRMIGDWRSDTWIGWSLDVADLDADGVSDIVTGAPGGGLGTVYIAYGPATGKMNAADAVAITSLGRNANLGDDIDGGDGNGDGSEDLLATTYGIDNSTDRGAYLFLGPITADRSTADADAFVSTDSVYETTGLIVPDATGDGDPDLVVGRSAESPRSFDGAVFVLPGPVTGNVSAATGAAYVYEPDTTNSSFGVALVDLGDTNGDGVTDLLASAPYIAAPAGGTIYLIAGGGTPGTYSVADAAYATLTSTPDANYGEITAVGDVDGDGNVDIVATGEGILDDGGDAADGPYLHLGPFAGARSTEDAAARWFSKASDRYVGRSLASGGDLDGDERDDLAVGAFNGTDYTWSGVFLQLGPASGAIEIETLPSIMGTSSDGTGARVSFVPDWDGDGRAEVAVAADGFSAGDPSRHVGAIFVVRSTELD